MAKYKLNLFSILGMFDRRNLDTYSSISDSEARKEFETSVGWILPQWMACAQNPLDHEKLILNFDEKASTVWHSTPGHHELQAKLLACCGLGRTVRHSFIKKSVHKYNSAVVNLLTQVYPDITPEEVEIWMRANNEEDLAGLAAACGYQPKEVTNLLKAFRGLKQ